MRKSTLLLLCASAAMAFSVGADARGPGGGGGGGIGGGFDSGFGHGSAVGPGTNGSAYENSNGRFAQDRDQGLERAEDRMSTEGLDHSKASDAQARRRQSMDGKAERRSPQRDSDR